jgi:hypothetical protein
MTDPLPSSPSCATLVVDEAITKPEALAAIAGAVGVPIERPRSAEPFVALREGAWAEVDIPKFGEAPPLAIDVYSVNGMPDAEASALALMARLAAATGWAVRPMFAR